MSRTRIPIVPFAVILVSGVVVWLAWPWKAPQAAGPPLPIVLSTSRVDLNDAEFAARKRLDANMADSASGVRLAEILLRKARVETNAAHAIEAEKTLRMVLKHEPSEYSALKLLGAVLLSQHRFAEAADLARAAMRVGDRDAWNYGVLGDASIELRSIRRGV